MTSGTVRLFVLICCLSVAVLMQRSTALGEEMPAGMPAPNQNAIAVGSAHTCALTESGGVKCWGSNWLGQLGDGTTVDSSTPVDTADLDSEVSAIAAGERHTCALTTDGGVKCWGDNSYGQLGDGTTTDRSTPVDVAGLDSEARAIVAGGDHTCALTIGGGVKCWGKNGRGQLGDGTTTDFDAGISTPVDVADLVSDVSAIAAGWDHTCALTIDGGVKCWGDNTYGQLGDGTTTTRTTPMDVAGLDNGAIAIAAGGEHTCALTANGGVKCWGYNHYGQLGDGTTTNITTGITAPVDVMSLDSDVHAIVAGGVHTCALTTGGGVKCWGSNRIGQLGDGSTTDRATPVGVAGLASDVIAIAAGRSHTCARTTGGGVKCWGWNGVGQLGGGTTTNRSTPVDVMALSNDISAIAAGGFHTCALTTGGGVKCWGSNYHGSLGDDTTVERSTPAYVKGLDSGIRAIASGSSHTCALTTGGDVRCWGDNYDGQLGDGTTTDRTTPVDVAGLDNEVIAIAAGPSHTCALTTGGGIKCWGENSRGQLGDGTTDSSMAPVNVVGLSANAIAVGREHTCALTTGGGVKCWGANGTGQLGDGTTTNRSMPVDVMGLDSGVRSLAVGDYHTCALTIDGGVKCWGLNRLGQLGDGTTMIIMIMLGIFHSDTPVDVVDLSSDVSTIAAGEEHTCALTAGGDVKCWGWNRSGQLGDGTTTDYDAGVSRPADVVGLSRDISALAGGGEHTCALTTVSGVKCWGANSRGQLGVNPGWTPVDVVWPELIFLPLITR